MAEYWQQSGTQHVLIYLYDNIGSPVGMMYRTNAYAADTYDYFLFEKNLQGDIVAVYNASGTKLLSYTYDAWGNCTVTGSTTTGAQYNPFRYRGYYYDSELGLYYLNSRYYDANTGRFINADIFVNANGGMSGYNMFAYCNNSPVAHADQNGKWVHIVVGAALGGVGSFVSTMLTGGSVQEALISAGIGVVSGALTAALPGAGVAISAIAGATESVLVDLYKIKKAESDPEMIAEKPTTTEVVTGAIVSAGLGALFGTGDDYFSSKSFIDDLTNTRQLVSKITSGNHPNVKRAANQAIRKFKKNVANESLSGLVDFGVSTVVSYGTKEYFKGWSNYMTGQMR